MMVMRRRAGETILIGDNIEIHITHIGRTRVKIAIDAPRDIPVMAKEVKLARDENLAAAQAHSGALHSLLARYTASGGTSNAPPDPRNRASPRLE
jgi:carbon storage regulator